MSKTDQPKAAKKDKKNEKAKKTAAEAEVDESAQSGFQLFKGNQSGLDDIFGKGVSRDQPLDWRQEADSGPRRISPCLLLQNLLFVRKSKPLSH